MTSTSTKKRFTPYKKTSLKPKNVKKIVSEYQNINKEPTTIMIIDTDEPLKEFNISSKNDLYEQLIKVQQRLDLKFKLSPQIELKPPLYFIVAFPPPQYNITCNIRPNFIIINCLNIDEQLLFKSTNYKVLNRLSQMSFKVLINDDLLSISSVNYEKYKKSLDITVKKNYSPQVSIKKCIIYFNIFYEPQQHWTVPEYLINIFDSATPKNVINNKV